MAHLLALLLLLAPAADREPVGGADWDRIEDPLERRVASLLAGDPVFLGSAAVVPLYARVPSEAGHGRPAEVACAGDGLRARFLVEDGRSYLRIANPTHTPVFLAAGTVFACGAVEIAVARDAVIPGDFAALVPAGPLVPGDSGEDLAPGGTLPPRAIGALLAGLPAFDAALADSRSLRGEDSYLPVLGSGAMLARRAALAAVLSPSLRGFGGTAVGAIFVVGDRPVAAHVFARHDLFLAALPDLLKGFAVEIRDRELRLGRAAARRQAVAADARSRALSWLRGIARERGPWSESYGAGFETLFPGTAQQAMCHAVVDQQRALVHAGFYAIDLPATGAGPLPPPQPPGSPDETPAGLRERKPRPTLEDQRRSELNPNPGPHGPVPVPGVQGFPAAGGTNPAGVDPASPRPR